MNGLCTLGILAAAGLGLSLSSSKAQQVSTDAQSFPVEIITSTLGGWSKPAFTANGRLAVLGNGNGAQLWDVQKNRLVRTFTGLGTINSAVALSPDGTRIAAGAGKVINIWNITTGRVEATLNLLMSRIDAISFSRDGTRLIYAGSTVGNQPKMVIADIGSGRVIKSFFSNNSAETLDLSPDGQLIALGDLSGVARIFDGNGRPLRTLIHRSNGRVKDLAFSPDGKLLATGGDDGAAKIWDVASGKLLRSLPGHEGDLHLVFSVSWSPDGNLLATTDSVALRIWNTKTGVLEAKKSFEGVPGTRAYVSLATFMPDGKSLIVDASGIKLVSVDRQETLSELGGNGYYSEFVKGVRIVGDEVYFESAYPRAISSFDFSTRKIRQVMQTGDEREGWGYVAGSNDGRRFVGVDNGNLLFFDTAISNQPRILLSGLKDCYVTAMSPNGDLVAAGNGAEAVVIGTKSGNVVKRFKADTKFSAGPTQLSFSEDGRVLVAAFIGNVIRVLQLSSANISATVTVDTYNTLSISPDSKSVLIGGTERDNLTVDYRSLENLQLISRLRIPRGESIAQPSNFDATGKFAIVGSFDGLLRLWDLSSGTMIRTFRGHTGPISEAQFISSGRRIVSSANDGFKLWDTSTGELLATYIISPNLEWLAITPEGFFDASNNGSKTLSIVRGLDVFSVDQFYDKLHRPDLVQQKLAGDPQGKVRTSGLELSLPKAVASGMAPIVSIISPISPTTTSDPQLVVEASASDQGGGIGKIEWRVNGTTLGVSQAKDGVGSNARAIYRKTFSLVAGQNRVEVVAYNSQGLISSDPAVAIVNLLQQQDYGPPQLHVLAVGVNEYWDSKLRLSFAVPDARSISESLQEAGKRLYDKIDVTTVLDADANADKLDQAFDEMSRRVHPQDVFIFFMSGHGKTVDGRFYFIPQDFRYSNEDSIVKSGINQDQLQRWFAKISAQKSLLLFDACESGALIGDRIASRGMEEKTAIDLMTRAMGRTVLTATTDDRPAAEGYRGHGVFTYAVLAALREADSNGDGLIDVLELANFVDREVPILTYDAWKMRQVPQMKIVGSNFPLVSKTALLPAADEELVNLPTMPTHVVIRKAIVRQTANGFGQSVTELSVGTQVRLVEAANGWALIAREGRKLGYIEAETLVTLH